MSRFGWKHVTCDVACSKSQLGFFKFNHKNDQNFDFNKFQTWIVNKTGSMFFCISHPDLCKTHVMWHGQNPNQVFLFNRKNKQNLNKFQIKKMYILHIHWYDANYANCIRERKLSTANCDATNHTYTCDATWVIQSAFFNNCAGAAYYMYTAYS